MRNLRPGVIASRGVVPEPSEERILRALGIPHLRQIDDIAEKGLRKAVRLAEKRALAMRSYEGTFRVCAVIQAHEEGVRIEGASEDFLGGQTLGKRFAKARAVALYAATLGSIWDEALDALAAQNEPAEAWFLDALGTYLVDQAARIIEEQAGRDATRIGLHRIGRYRPGYPGFQAEKQAELCSLVEAARVGISHNEAMSLWPRKSITGLVGFAEESDPIDEPSSSEAEIRGKETA